MVKNTVLKAILLTIIVRLVSSGGVGLAADIPSAGQPGAVEKSIEQQPVQKPTRLPEIKMEEEGVPRLTDGGIKFELKSIIFEGNTVFSSEQLKSVVAGYMGQTMEAGKLGEIAAAVTAYYAKAGYFLTRAYVPPQTIKDGQVLIRIREGRLGDIIIDGNKRYSRELIDNTLKIIRERGAVRTEDVERGLLLLMDHPGLVVKATFKAGSKPGTTDIVLTVTEGRPYDFSVDYDNFGSRFVSGDRFGATLGVYGTVVEGDSLNLRGVTGSSGVDDLFYGRVEYVMPLGYRGMRLGINYTHLQYGLGREFEALDAGGKSDGGGIWMSYPLMRSRDYNWFVEGGFNANDVSQKIAGQTSGKDNIRNAHLGTTFQWLDSLDGSNQVNVRGYRGFAGILGGTERGSMDTIRVNTDIAYSKVEMGLVRIQRLPVGFTLLLNGTGQWSPDRLPSSEEFHLGGAGTVRGYAQGERSGDSGLAATAELRIPVLGLQDKRWFGRTVGDTFQFAVFYDYGKVWITDAAQNGEQARESLDMQSAGAGIRVAFTPYVRFKLDWAKSVGGTDPLEKSDKDRGIWTAQLILSF
jgi:hemolysin activation/secretion protein